MRVFQGRKQHSCFFAGFRYEVSKKEDFINRARKLIFMGYDVFGLGNPFMDVLIKAEDDELKKINLKKGMIRFVNQQEILEIHSMFSHKVISYEPGGSVANTISTISRLGGKTFFTGKAGNDELAMRYIRAMKQLKVDIELPKSRLITARALTFITPDSERSFIDYLGAASDFEVKDLNKDALKSSKFFHVSAYFLEEKKLRESAKYAMQIAKANDIKISIDCGDALLIQRIKNEMIKIIEDYADIVFANAEEAKALSNLNSPEEALNFLSDKCRIAVVKLGDKGSLIKQKNKVYKIKALQVKAVDSTGAGDAYAGGMLFGLSRGLSIEKSARIATFLGGKVVETFGARLKEINYEEVMKNGL